MNHLGAGQGATGVSYNTGASASAGAGVGVGGGGLVLRCTAQIGDLYQEYKEIELGTPQKDPVPARGESIYLNTYTNISSCIITKTYIW